MIANRHVGRFDLRFETLLDRSSLRTLKINLHPTVVIGKIIIRPQPARDALRAHFLIGLEG